MDKKILFVLGMVLLVVSVNAELYYKVDVSYADERYSIDSVDVIYSRLAESNFEGDDFRVVLNSGSTSLYEEKFNLGGYNYIENLSEENAEFEFLTEYTATIYVPYDSKADELIVYDDLGREVVSYDVSSSISQEASLDRPLLPEAPEEDVSSNEIYGYVILVLLALISFWILFYYHFYHRKRKGK